jgi:hypothetical protein
MDWHWIGIGLTLDWHQIGMGWRLIVARSTSDRRQVDTALASDWDWIDID